MLASIYNQSLSFLTSKDFWDFHGYGLTFLWIVLATVAICVRYIKGKLSKNVHFALFVIIDYATLYLGGGVVYRLWGRWTTSFFKWSLIKQAHVVLGIALLVCIMVQHLAGALVYYTGRLKGQHIKYGFILHMLVGVLAIGGWLIKWNLKNAISTVFFYIMSMMLISFFKTKKKERREKTIQLQKEKAN